MKSIAAAAAAKPRADNFDRGSSTSGLGAGAPAPQPDPQAALGAEGGEFGDEEEAGADADGVADTARPRKSMPVQWPQPAAGDGGGGSNSAPQWARGHPSAPGPAPSAAKKPRLGTTPKIVVLWNNCTEQFEPGSDGWSLYGLSECHLMLVVDPLGTGLFRVRLYSDDKMIFPDSVIRHGGGGGHVNPRGSVGSANREMHAAVIAQAAASVSESVSAGQLLGPLQHGMVVSQRLLGPLIRETATNASRRVQEYWARRREVASWRHMKSSGPAVPHERAHGVNGSLSNPYVARAAAIARLSQHARPAQNSTMAKFLQTALSSTTQNKLHPATPTDQL